MYEVGRPPPVASTLTNKVNMLYYLCTPFSGYEDKDARMKAILAKVADLSVTYPDVSIVSGILYYPLLVDSGLLPGLKDPPFDWWYRVSDNLVKASNLVLYWNPDNMPSTGCDKEIATAIAHNISVVKLYDAPAIRVPSTFRGVLRSVDTVPCSNEPEKGPRQARIA